MGLTSSRGKRPARLHSSMMGIRLSSMNLRVVSRTRRSSSVSRVIELEEINALNLMAGIRLTFVAEYCDAEREGVPWRKPALGPNLIA